jgi:D-serine deaminase-like pyridoxal phosphate-dependent protein
MLPAYPSADRAGFAEPAADPEPAGTVTVTVDAPAQLDLIDASRGAAGTETVRVCLELDTSIRALGGLLRFGALRSPPHSPERTAEPARVIAARPGFRLVGIMAYEGHIAGGRPADRAAGAFAGDTADAARGEPAARRAEAVRAVREAVPDLEFVNGGGTGSVQSTAAQDAVTEIAAGSGLSCRGCSTPTRPSTAVRPPSSRSRWSAVPAWAW